MDSARCNHEGELRRNPSRFTLEGLHDKVVSGVVKEESPSVDHDHTSYTTEISLGVMYEVPLSTLDGNSAESTNKKGRNVM